PAANEIVLNEVLFNPPANGADFVEIYNRSDKIFDLQQVKLANRDKENKVAAIQTVSQQYYLRPREYAVFTADLNAVQQFYSVPFPEKVILLKTLPSYPNESGCVVLLNENEEVIDEFLYSEDMHSGFISNPKGISLERVNPDRPGNERANWQSAAQDVGFATPTYRNSQYNPSEERVSGVFNLPYEVFSPDGNGYNDVLYIDYNVGTAGYVANITIYDTQGRLVKEVEKKALLGVSGRFAWDGTRHDNRKAGIGMYIIFIEYFDLNGRVTRLKKPCALAGR
ncbi:MAG: lamin tail domain-containing protein, partial [Prevotellaceae bacterium]|nr:lamin tail domain-containing protein [Prevotellaceae bacterium]